jgi:hypothetical protein
MKKTTDAAAADMANGHRLSSARRRRLWELPTQAHELLLAMSFSPDALRHEVARTLGQVHKAMCKLGGRDVDVLYGTVHDLAERNPLSEALHKRLDAIHALALPRWRRMPDAPALRTAWAEAQQGAAAGLAGELWALLTHPQGPELQTEALYDARAWVFGHARAHLARCGGHERIEQRWREAQTALGLLQARSQQQQHTHDAQLRGLREALAQAQGQVSHWQQRALRAEAPAPPKPEPGVRRPDQPARPIVIAAAATEPAAARPRVPQEAPCSEPTTPAPATAVPIDGRQVLCVGGIRRAVARYRSRIEKLGGRFEHHDGGIEDGLQGLDGRLHRADLVICQAGCINHEAYHRIKRHCERTGKPCVYLERPSLTHLDRALAAWASA